MIRHIKLLQNIGTFDSDTAAATIDLKRLCLIYADNARGKTTLAAILRSLASGHSLPIEERKRLGSNYPPRVVLECEGNSFAVRYENAAWNQTIPDLKIFDDVFVDENVYSGLDVESLHRQNLHQLILGDHGVALNRRLREVVSKITGHNTELEKRGNAIPANVRGGIPVEAYCELAQNPDVDDQIQDTERELVAAENQNTVQESPLFRTVDLPRFDIDSINQVLSLDLQDLDKTAEERVKSHVLSLGDGGENWLADGMSRLDTSADPTCPFCGRGLNELDLIAHFRAYFSENYTRLKNDISDLVDQLNQDHEENKQVEFQQSVNAVMQTKTFWDNYCQLPEININADSIANDWRDVKAVAINTLKAKQAAPLDRQEFSGEALSLFEKFSLHRDEVKVANESLAAANEIILEVKKRAIDSNVEEIRAKLVRLKAIKARFSEEISALCRDYLQEKEAKTLAEAERVEARDELGGYRSNIFPTLEDGVNHYLERFGASFRIRSLQYSNIGGGTGSTCTYNVIINSTSVEVRGAAVEPGKPSFRNTLSAGDRNTLALALFFSTLDQNPSLKDTIVVIDDPISSLDDHRSLATIQRIRRLAQETKQVLVLSHSKRLLCGIWSGANRKDCSPLEIVKSAENSTLREWDVSEDATTEHDQRHALLREYATNQNVAENEVAAAIRPHLEGFLRVACPGDFPPRKSLGQFIKNCHEREGTGDEILNASETVELEEIVEYGNRFHHDADEAWEPGEINPTELLVFVNRTLKFAGL